MSRYRAWASLIIRSLPQLSQVIRMNDDDRNARSGW
jgi:hypothetical protein